MRLSPHNGLTGLTGRAIVLALGVALAVTDGALAETGSGGRATAPLSAPGPSSPLSIEVAGLPKVELPKVELPKVELPKVELPKVELPKVELPKVELPKVELPKVELPKVELPKVEPPPPKVKGPSPPPVEVPTPPTGSTPAPKPPGSPAPGGGSTFGGGGGNGAHAASAGSATPTGVSTAGAVGGGVAPKVKRVRGSRQSSAIQTAPGLATVRSSASHSAATGPVTSTLAVSSPAALRRASTPSRSPRRSSNPLDAIGRQIPFPVPVPDWSKPIILALLLLAIWFAARLRVAAVRARRLQGQRAALLQDLDVMQAALVPVIPARLGELAVSVAYQPADGPAAGGDFYDLFVLEPGKVAIILGDVAGHGHDALKQAALTRYTLRAYMQAGMEPRAALALAGSVLADPGRKPFATVVIGVHDSASGRLTYASAGHPAPIAIGFDTPEPLTVCCSAPICCNLPTGLRQTTISVPAGGEVCFFSDGLIEARTADGLLGRERLMEILEQLGPRATGEELLAQVRAAAHSTPDDMVACIVSPRVAGAALASQVEELEVDAEMLGHADVREFLEACGVRATDVSSLLARAAEIAGNDATALLRIERPPAGEATTSVLPGLSAPAWAAVGRLAHDEPAVVLPSGR
jgi:hypothetical protein